MSLTNDQITAKNFQEFYAQIRPYLNGQVPPVFNKFSKSDLYSTDEKIVGQWIDGKPLYQKTYSATVSLASGRKWVIVDSNFANKEFKGLANGSYLLMSNGTIYPIPISTDSNLYIGFNYDGSISKIQLVTTLEGNVSYYVTVLYTKTTDSPISIGNDTDYSTTEKIVGTWIDGKPLYQKTISSTLISSSGWTDQPHNISNIDFAQIIGFSITNYALGGTNNNSLMAHVGTVNLEIYNNNSSLYGKTAYVTFQYTKTTD